MKLMNTAVAALVLATMGLTQVQASVVITDVFKSKYMTQPAFEGVGAVTSIGGAQNNRAFYEQDFKKMTVEQKEFAALNMLRELAFFNIKAESNFNTMAATEKELYVNKRVSDPIHQRDRTAIQKVVKDILESTDFTTEKNPSVAKLKKLLVKINLLVAEDKNFEFVNEYRENRFNEVFDSGDVNKIWAELFAAKYGATITPTANVMMESLESKTTVEEFNTMFEALKAAN